MQLGVTELRALAHRGGLRSSAVIASESSYITASCFFYRCSRRSFPALRIHRRPLKGAS